MNSRNFFPKTLLPLNIFEPRYIEMINDAMSGNRIIGMIRLLFFLIAVFSNVAHFSQFLQGFGHCLQEFGHVFCKLWYTLKKWQFRK